MGIWARCSAWAEEVRPSLSAPFDGLRQRLGCLSALSWPRAPPLPGA